MKKVICSCNTYYQIIFAMQLRETIYKDSYFAIIISDHSKNADRIGQNLLTMNYFDEVIYVKTRSADHMRNGLKSYRILKQQLSKLKQYVYDEFLYFNFTKSAILFFSLLRHHNKNISCSRFEEGVLSYDSAWNSSRNPKDYSRSMQLMLTIGRIQYKKDMLEKLNNFYCYYPELYEGDLKPCKVPLISNGSDVASVITNIFEINKEALNYKEKYIFFTGVYDFEGEKSIGEYNLVKNIAELIGKENLLIKLHPRDTRNIYEKEGFRVDQNSHIPFEALLLTYDFSEKKLLTATSGACLSAGMMLEKSPKMFYMYDLCEIETNFLAKTTVDNLKKVLNSKVLKTQLKDIKVCQTITDIVS